MPDTTQRRTRSRRDTSKQSGTHHLATLVADTNARPDVLPGQIDIDGGTYDTAAAERDVAIAAQAKIEADLVMRLERLRKAQAAATKLRGELDKAVALAITSEPTRVNWYDHPGPLSRARVSRAAGVTPVQLQRLMERYRAGAGGPARKGKR